MYLYLTLLSAENGDCHPTIEQIREDLGLYSASVVFEALTVLESLGFVTRERRSFAGTRAKRNVYRRTPCAVTIVRLLEEDRIDGHLHPKGSNGSPAAPQSRALADEGLRELLGSAYSRYEAAPEHHKHDTLLELLRAGLERERNANGIRPE